MGLSKHALAFPLTLLTPRRRVSPESVTEFIELE